MTLNVGAARRPAPLVRPDMVTEVSERIDRDGEVLAPLLDDAAERTVGTALADADTGRAKRRVSA